MSANVPPSTQNSTPIDSPKNRSTALQWVRILIAIVVLGSLVIAIRPAALFETALQADPFWLLAAAFLLPLNIASESAIWLPLLRLIVPGEGWLSATRAVLGGYPLGFFTPGRVGEFAGRALTLSDENRLTVGLSVAAARIPELAALLTAGSPVLLLAVVRGEVDFPGARWLTGIALAGAALCWILICSPNKAATLARRASWSSAVADKVEFLARTDFRIGVRVVALSFLRLYIYCTQFVMLARAFAPTVSAGTAYEAVLSTFTAKAIIPPVTFLDLGIREGAAAFFFGQLGIGTSVGFNAAMALFLINVVVPTAIGLPLVSRYRLESARPESVRPESQGTAEVTR